MSQEVQTMRITLNMKHHLFNTLFISTILYLQPLQAATFTLTPNSDIVGEIQYVTVKKGDSMYSIARSHDLGLMDMLEANPNVNPDKLVPGNTLLVPTQFILPPGPREGIVINLAEIRVYFFPPNTNIVMTFPLGIGEVGWRTPIGETTIIRKRENPTWTPPASIHAEAARKGRTLPKVVAAGPKNPLGSYAMNLGWNGYLMHGTQAPTSIGQRSSHGCMRMYPEDIKALFHAVTVGTKVRAIYEPYKIGMKDGKLFIEAHELFPDNYYKIRYSDKFDALQNTVADTTYPQSDAINWLEVKVQIDSTNGYPVEITSTVPGNPKQDVPQQVLQDTEVQSGSDTI